MRDADSQILGAREDLAQHPATGQASTTSKEETPTVQVHNFAMLRIRETLSTSKGRLLHRVGLHVCRARSFP
jgi:hypothetical protein